jgi:hypothetical protein
LTGIESWKELPLLSGPKKLVSEIILCSMQDRRERGARRLQSTFRFSV